MREMVPEFFVLIALFIIAGTGLLPPASAVGRVDACAVISNKDAALMLPANPVIQARAQPSTTFSTCVYRPSSNSGERLSITVNIAAKGTYRHVLGKIGDTTFAPVSGLGDRAYMATSPQKIHLGVQRGKTVLALDFSGKSDSQKQEALRRIARTALGRLP